MKVSVVIPVYNLEKYVEAAVDSVLGQSHPPFEVIAVDDTSTDRSPQVLRRYGDELIVLRNERNVGVMRTTLNGIARATGDVVAVLSGDDEWAPRKLEAVSALFEADPRLVIVSHDYHFIDAAGRVTFENDPTQEVLKRALRAGDLDRVSRAMIDSILEYRGNVWLGSGWSFRRGALDLGTFRRRVDDHARPHELFEDHPLATFLLLTSAGRCAYVDQPLLRYRVHATNFSGAATDLARARRIITMGRATAQFTHDIVADYGEGWPAAPAAQRAHVREFDYLAALYAGEIGRALGYYREGFGASWSVARYAREVLRLGTVALFGAERFFALKNRVASFRS
jgi:glycosyltransferase involved in cell wall biosynthesis